MAITAQGIYGLVRPHTLGVYMEICGVEYRSSLRMSGLAWSPTSYSSSFSFPSPSLSPSLFPSFFFFFCLFFLPLFDRLLWCCVTPLSIKHTNFLRYLMLLVCLVVCCLWLNVNRKIEASFHTTAFHAWKIMLELCCNKMKQSRDFQP